MTDMKQVHIYIAALMLVCGAFSASAQQILGGDASISNVKYGKIEDRMFVSMDITPNDKWNVKSNLSIVLTPRIENDENSISLPQVQILGRNQYLRHLRKASEDATGSQVYQASKTRDVHYEVSVPYEEWMDNSELILNEDLCGCTKTLLANAENQIERYMAPVAKPVFKPVFAYVVPKAESVKARSESGQAYVTFHVSKTDIDDIYLNNREELQKIRKTIASVREDKDVTITGLYLKGYASPEGKYQDNAYLAKGRTEAVADYIRRLSGGVDYPITTAYEAENWEGLREYISQSDFPEKEELLAIIDSSAFKENPDGREWKIKSSYPDVYLRLLTNCYPFLRRTDYRVEYTVRQFNLEEARALIGSQPQKLSLQEIYNVAQTYEPGSEAYNDVFDTAVRLFPDDETANLNAANSALQRGDTQLARKYLLKAGDSGEAVVTRGILAMLDGDEEIATTLMREAQAMGVKEATSNLEQIQAIIN
jgi:outer membrane protein OmpA-like peptidoglycan-associated protein